MKSDKLNAELIEMLDVLKREHLLMKAGETSFELSLFPVGITLESTSDAHRAQDIVDEKKKILLKIANTGAIEATPTNDVLDGYDSCFFVKVNPAKFEELYESLDTASSANQDKMRLFIDSEGNFWREPKDKFLYPMGKGGLRLKILKYLVDNVGLQDTGTIAESLNVTEKRIQNEIGKIRDNMSKYLKIDGKTIIEGKKDSGYGIRPAFTFVEM